jgi:hypothetical protein
VAKISGLEANNYELEVENSKLRQIVEENIRRDFENAEAILALLEHCIYDKQILL